MNGVWCAGY